MSDEQVIPPGATPRRVLIMMSDTGGGHRAAAEAIDAALKQRHGDSIQVDVVDVFRNYSPAPFKYAPEIYPIWIKRGRLMWRMGYGMFNRRRQVFMIARSLGLALHRGFKRLFKEHPADVIICVHPLFPAVALNVLRRMPDRPPFITVITDLVSTHAFWYERGAERILVPTPPAYERGIKLGVPPEKLRVTGLPVHPRFAKGLIGKDEARSKLGWDEKLPTVLMVGGGDGMGPLFRIARAINKLNAPCQLAIVAGRNAELYENLKSKDWNQPTHIYGFVTNMPELMAGADILVTKAGPATISEACMAALPMILSDAIPGQETGNVRYIRDNKAGVYAPGPRKVAKAIGAWLSQGQAFLDERAESARKLAQPDAVWQIADEIWEYANKPRIPRQASMDRRKRKKGTGTV